MIELGLLGLLILILVHNTLASVRAEPEEHPRPVNHSATFQESGESSRLDPIFGN
jgi:hypothetical protein